jgi:hypothetical protein
MMAILLPAVATWYRYCACCLPPSVMMMLMTVTGDRCSTCMRSCRKSYQLIATRYSCCLLLMTAVAGGRRRPIMMRTCRKSCQLTLSSSAFTATGTGRHCRARLAGTAAASAVSTFALCRLLQLSRRPSRPLFGSFGTGTNLSRLRLG